MSGYDDMLHLPRHSSPNRPHMPVSERAAQFAPFAALRGYDEEIGEAARTVSTRYEPDESRLSGINETLVLLKARERERPAVRITYFKPDEKKDGGEFITVTGCVKKLDETAGRMYLEETAVWFHEIVEIELL